MLLYLLSFVISPMKIGKRNLRMADVSPRIAAEGRFVRRPLPAMSEEKHLPFADGGKVAWNLAPHGGKKEKKRGEIGKISVREANRARCSGEGERERASSFPNLVPYPKFCVTYEFHIRQVKCLVRGGCQFGRWNQVTTVTYWHSSEEVVTKLKDGG